MDIKITGAYQQYISPPIKVNNVQPANMASATSRGDKVSLSQQAEDYKTAIRAINLTPDVRHELVESIRDMIAGGNYNISPQAVAARIFHGLEN